MLVVSDTSPLTALLTIGREDLLRALFAQVLIPPAVETELRRSHPLLPDWLQVKTPTHIPDAILNVRLDPGETEALALALELRADTVLMDERFGRQAARELGLRATGLLGCLIQAKEARLLNAIAPVINELQNVAGCWFSDSLVAATLRAAGELA